MDDSKSTLPDNPELVENGAKEVEVSLQYTARSVIQLGRQSISNSITAIIELIKNSYDADAETVSLFFSGLDADKPLMVIEDNGCGMTEAQFRQNWLTIGTLNKSNTSTSIQKKRVLTGEKGLGRLGLDRLCERTIVRTFTEEQEYGIELDIDWKKYEEQADSPLHAVTHSLRQISKQNKHPVTGQDYIYEHGTQLILYDLKDDWSTEYLTKLRDEISLLVSPFAGINDFLIELETGLGLPELNGFIESKHLLELAEWRIVSTVDEEGVVLHHMESDVFNKSYEQLRSWKEIVPFDNRKSPRCGALKFELYFYGGDSAQAEEYSLTRAQIRQFLSENQGVRIYRDHFRVKPYGQPDGQGDWLTLALRKTRSPGGVVHSELGRWRLGYNQVVGAVFISRDNNPNLIDQTNREGIIEGPGYTDMRQFALDSVRFFERQRQEFEKERFGEEDVDIPEFESAKASAEKSTQESTKAVGELKELIDTVQHHITSGAPPTKEMANLALIAHQVEKSVTEIKQRQDAFVRAAEVEREALREQKDTLGNLASLGILAVTFGHETRASSNLVQATAQDVARSLRNNSLLVLPNVKAELDEDLEILIRHAERIESFAEFTLQNVSRDKRKRVDVYLDQVIRRVFMYFEESFRDQQIEAQLDLPKSVTPIRAFLIDWESILVNFISNSIWALSARTAEEGRIIRVRLKEDDEDITLEFADSGVGITVEPLSDIFRAGISEKKNEQGDVIGTGMGLFIVKSFIESYPKGKISVLKQCDLGGAEFKLKIGTPRQRGGK